MDAENPVIRKMAIQKINQDDLATAVGKSRPYVNSIIHRRAKSPLTEYLIARQLKEDISVCFPDRKKRGPQAARISGSRGSKALTG
jgi:hypothetical protein